MKFLINFILVILISLPILGSPPKLIPVQGILTEADGRVINGNVNLTLSLFDAQTDGDELWKEERDDFKVENGYISLYLGELEEIDASVITKADELWLEIIFNGERMPRVRLASVPFALEAINAQKIGDVTSSQINNMFNTACNDGYYIKGYDTEGNAICAEDKLGETQESITYNAGSGINIDDSNSISVSDDLYVAGNGIQVNNGIISITNDVARNPHKHDNLYYEKSNNATNDNLVKFSGNNADGYKLEKSSISETNGELTVGSIKSVNSETGNITNITSTQVNSGRVDATLMYVGYLNLGTATGRIDTTVIKTKGIELANYDWTINARISKMEHSVEYSVSGNNNSVNMTSKASSICFLTKMTITWDEGKSCSISTAIINENETWRLTAYNDGTHNRVTCSARCLSWN